MHIYIIHIYMLLPIDLFRAVAEGVEISGIHSLPDGAQAITQMTISKCNVAGHTQSPCIH